MNKRAILGKYLSRYKLIDQCPYKIEIRKIGGKEYIWLMAVDLGYLIQRSTEKGSITLNIPSIVEGIDCRSVFRLYRDTMTFYLKDRLRGISLEDFTESIHKLRIIGNDNKLVATNGLLSLDIDEIHVTDSMETDPHYEGYLDTLDDFDLEMEDEENMYCFDLKELIIENFDARNMNKISCLKDDDIKISFINCKIGNLCRASEFYNLINNSDGFDFQRLDYSNLEQTYRMFEGSEITNEQLQKFNISDSSKILNSDSMFCECKKLKRIPDLNLQVTLNQNFMYQDQSVGGSLILGRNICKPGTAQYRGQTSVASQCLSKYENTLLENVIVDGCEIIAVTRDSKCSELQRNVHTLTEQFKGCKLLNTVQFRNITYNFGSMRFENGGQISDDDIKYGRVGPLPNVGVTRFSNNRQLGVLYNSLQNSGQSGLPYVNLTRMFEDCENLQTLEIENVYMPYLGVGLCQQFKNCKNLRRIIIKNVIFQAVYMEMPNQFLGCNSLAEVQLINVIQSCNIDIEEVFRKEFKAAGINPKIQSYVSKDLELEKNGLSELRQNPVAFYSKMLQSK